MSASVREFVKTELSALCPSSWVWIASQRMPDTIAKTTVVVKHGEIEALPEAPIGNLKHSVTLSVFDPHTDVATAEDELDDAVTDLLTAIDGIDTIAWTKATKVISPNEQYFGWDITLIVNTQKEA